MARSMPSPWIKELVMSLISDQPDRANIIAAKLPARFVQVVSVFDNLNAIVINDRQHLVTVFLTQTAADSIRSEYDSSLDILKNSISKIADYHVTTVLQNASNRDLNTMCAGNKISLPLALQANFVEYGGNSDLTIMSEPSDINTDANLRQLIARMSYIGLSTALAEAQFPKQRQLPDAEGRFCLLVDGFSDERPLRSEDAIIPANQLETLAALDTFEHSDQIRQQLEMRSLLRKTVASDYSNYSPDTQEERQDQDAYISAAVLHTNPVDEKLYVEDRFLKEIAVLHDTQTQTQSHDALADTQTYDSLGADNAALVSIANDAVIISNQEVSREEEVDRTEKNALDMVREYASQVAPSYEQSETSKVYRVKSNSQSILPSDDNSTSSVSSKLKPKKLIKSTKQKVIGNHNSPIKSNEQKSHDETQVALSSATVYPSTQIVPYAEPECTQTTPDSAHIPHTQTSPLLTPVVSTQLEVSSEATTVRQTPRDNMLLPSPIANTQVSPQYIDVSNSAAKHASTLLQATPTPIRLTAKASVLNSKRSTNKANVEAEVSITSGVLSSSQKMAQQNSIRHHPQSTPLNNNVRVTDSVQILKQGVITPLTRPERPPNSARIFSSQRASLSSIESAQTLNPTNASKNSEVSIESVPTPANSKSVNALAPSSADDLKAPANAQKKSARRPGDDFSTPLATHVNALNTVQKSKATTGRADGLVTPLPNGTSFSNSVFQSRPTVKNAVQVLQTAMHLPEKTQTSPPPIAPSNSLSPERMQSSSPGRGLALDYRKSAKSSLQSPHRDSAKENISRQSNAPAANPNDIPRPFISKAQSSLVAKASAMISKNMTQTQTESDSIPPPLAASHRRESAVSGIQSSVTKPRWQKRSASSDFIKDMLRDMQASSTIVLGVTHDGRIVKKRKT